MFIVLRLYFKILCEIIKNKKFFDSLERIEITRIIIREECQKNANYLTYLKGYKFDVLKNIEIIMGLATVCIAADTLFFREPETMTHPLFIIIFITLCVLTVELIKRANLSTIFVVADELDEEMKYILRGKEEESK